MLLSHRIRRPEPTAPRSGQPSRPVAVAAGTGRPVPPVSRPAPEERPAGRPAPARPLPPSVARLEGRTRLAAELLAAMLEVEERTHASLDDIERADALADRLIARRARRRRGVPTPGQARLARFVPA